MDFSALIKYQGRVSMNRDEIKNKIIDIIDDDLGVRHADLNDDLTLREGLGLDSVDIVSVISQIERQFKIRLTQVELENIRTVGQTLDLIMLKLASAVKSEAA